MRYNILRAASVALIVIAAAAPAFADPPQKASATFEPLAASGVSGDARLQEMNDGSTRIHGSLRGLEPNVEYVSVIFQNASCSAVSGDEGVQIVTFTANPAGIANYNVQASQELSAIGSIAVWPTSTQTLVACGAVTLEP